MSKNNNINNTKKSKTTYESEARMERIKKTFSNVTKFNVIISLFFDASQKLLVLFDFYITVYLIEFRYFSYLLPLGYTASWIWG